MDFRNPYDGAKFRPLLRAASRAASVTGTVVDIRDYEGTLAVLLDSNGGAGGTRTLDVVIQESANGSTGWSTLASFAQVTTAASLQGIKIDVNQCERYIRAVGTNGAGSTYIYAVHFVGGKKYMP
jgi:hypothetical protein